MKKFKSFLSLTLITFMFSVVQATASDEIKVILNGKQLSFTQPPVIVNNRTLVPMRAIFEALGAEVTWNADTKTATGTKKGIKVELTISDSTMTRNYVPVPIDVPAKIINNSTMIPLRVVSECFGMDVKWDADTRVITIAETNPVGRLPWNDYYYYYGEIVDGQGIGYGELYSIETDELSCSGYFNGTTLTEGMNIQSNGNITIGTYNNDGLLTGNAYLITTDWYYIGNFVNGIRNGSGECYWSNGDKYVGNWIDGDMNGQGTYYCTNGDKYVGTFVAGKKNGQGIYYYSYNDRYEGNWVNDKQSGQGTYYWAYGDKYIGTFANGDMNGQGTYYCANGDKYVGNWVNGKKNNYGIYYWAFGDCYEGSWINDNMNGQGTYYCANGDKYVGNWVDGKKNGYGIYYWANGTHHSGNWVNDQPTN